MKVLVTGGAGFIGVNLVHRLLREGIEVTILDDFSTGLRENVTGLPITVFKGSITDEETVKVAMDGVSHVVHLAARGSVPRSLHNPIATHTVNATGSLNVLEASRQQGAHFVAASSSSVYGANLESPKDEMMRVAPMTPYAASKLAAESYVQAYQHSYGLEALTFRFFNVFGPWQRPDHEYAAVIPKWIWKALQGEQITVNGDGGIIRDFTYVDDVVELLMQAIEGRVSHPIPINLAFGNPVSLLDIVEALRGSLDGLTEVYGPGRPGDVLHSENDPSLLLSIFPNVTTTPFEVGLAKTIQWLSEHGDEVVGGPPIND